MREDKAPNAISVIDYSHAVCISWLEDPIEPSIGRLTIDMGDARNAFRFDGAPKEMAMRLQAAFHRYKTGQSRMPIFTINMEELK